MDQSTPPNPSNALLARALNATRSNDGRQAPLNAYQPHPHNISAGQGTPQNYQPVVQALATRQGPGHQHGHADPPQSGASYSNSNSNQHSFRPPSWRSRGPQQQGPPVHQQSATAPPAPAAGPGRAMQETVRQAMQHHLPLQQHPEQVRASTQLNHPHSASGQGSSHHRTQLLPRPPAAPSDAPSADIQAAVMTALGLQPRKGLPANNQSQADRRGPAPSTTDVSQRTPGTRTHQTPLSGPGTALEHSMNAARSARPAGPAAHLGHARPAPYSGRPYTAQAPNQQTSAPPRDAYSSTNSRYGGGGGSYRSSSRTTSNDEVVAAWPAGCDWLSSVSWGVKIKGTRLARMQDGVMDTEVGHMFRCFSASGQAEYWPADMLACLCGCPNDSDCCSHLYGLVVAKPEYRPKFALLIKARELFDVAAARHAPLEPVIQQLSSGLLRFLQQEMPTLSPRDVCNVAAEGVVALLLQRYVEEGAHTRRPTWWRGGVTVQAAGRSSPAKAVTPKMLTDAILAAAGQLEQELKTQEETVLKRLQQKGKGVARDHAAGAAARSGTAASSASQPEARAPVQMDLFDGLRLNFSSTSLIQQLHDDVCDRLGVEALDQISYDTTSSTRDARGSVLGKPAAASNVDFLTLFSLYPELAEKMDLLLSWQARNRRLLEQKGREMAGVEQPDSTETGAAAGLVAQEVIQQLLRDLQPEHGKTVGNVALRDEQDVVFVKQVVQLLVKLERQVQAGAAQQGKQHTGLLQALSCLMTAPSQDQSSSGQQAELVDQLMSALCVQLDLREIKREGTGKEQPEAASTSPAAPATLIPAEELYAFCSQAHAAAADLHDNEAFNAELEQAACCHYHVSSFTDLGHGPLAAVMTQLGQLPTQQAQGGHQAAAHAEALLMGTTRDEHVRAEQPDQCVIQLHDPDLATGAAAHSFKRVTLRHIASHHVLVDPAQASVHHVQQAVMSRDGVHAVHALLAVLVSYGGFGRLPRELIMSSIQQALDLQLSSQPVSTQAQPWAQYALDVLLSLPSPFNSRPQVMSLLLPRTLLQAQGVVEAVIQLVAGLPSHYLHRQARQRVRQAGQLLSIPAWQQLVVPPPAAGNSSGQNLPDTASNDEAAATQAAVTAASQPQAIPPAQARVHQQASGQQVKETGVGGDARQSVPPVNQLQAVTRPVQVDADAARAVIEDIRSREFGIGVAVSEQVQAVLSAQHARLRRALERLSADLYSQKVHLLTELLQNADDCRYEQESVPTLGLWVGHSGLAAACNETGFTESDVRALCDVGASSKAVAKQVPGPAPAADGASLGQTGEKGIGFKSVFSVTDKPHVSSNGFMFGFDALDPSGCGMVLPHWLGARADEQGSAQQAWAAPGSWPCPPGVQGTQPWTTHIWMPASTRLLDKGSTSPDAWSRVAAELVTGVTPSLLLFLRRIQRLVLHDQFTQQVHVLTRTEDTAISSIQVKHTVYAAPEGRFLDLEHHQPISVQMFNWLCAAHTINRPSVPRRTAHLPCTQLKVALPSPAACADASDSTSGTSQAVSGGLQKSSSSSSDPGCEVYAYLPIRSFGLPFALQADWLLSSSREDLLAGEAWNQLLREEVPQAFLQALDLANRSPTFKYRWLSFVPLPSTTQPFFRPLCTTIPAALASRPCVATTHKEIPLAQPHMLLIAPKEVHELVPAALLWQVLGRHFAHPDLFNSQDCSVGSRASANVHAAEQALESLGAQHFSAEHLVQLLEVVGMQQVVTHSLSLSATTTTDQATDVDNQRQQQCSQAWRVLALLEQLLSAAETTHVPPGAPRSQLPSRHLSSKLSSMLLLPLIDGSWAAPAASPVLTPHFNDKLQDLDDVEDGGPAPVGSTVEDQARDPRGSHEAGRKSLLGLVTSPASVIDGRASVLQLLPVIDVDVLLDGSLPPAVRHTAAQCLTARLHVRPGTPVHVINHHVLPALARAKSSALDSQATLSYVLLPCATYLMRNKHLAESSDQVAAVWRDSLSWCLTKPTLVPPPTPSATSPSSPGPCSTQPREHVTTQVQMVPSHEGILLSLSFLGMQTATADAATAEEGSDGHDQSPWDQTAWQLPVDLQAACASAYQSTFCCLHPDYLQHGTRQEWFEFIHHTLRCGFTLVRPAAPAASAVAADELVSNRGSSRRAVQGLHSDDLHKLLDWFHMKQDAQDQGGPWREQALKQAAWQFWQTLDKCWQGELSAYANLAHAALPQSVAGRQETIGELLYRCRCLLVGPAQPSRHASRPSLQEVEDWDTLSWAQPEHGPWAACTLQSSVLGAASNVICRLVINQPGLQRCLNIQTQPTPGLLLHQLYRWSCAAAGPAPDAAALSQVYSCLAAACSVSDDDLHPPGVSQHQAVQQQQPQQQPFHVYLKSCEQQGPTAGQSWWSKVQTAFHLYPLLAVQPGALPPATHNKPDSDQGTLNAAPGSDLPGFAWVKLPGAGSAQVVEKVFWSDPSGVVCGIWRPAALQQSYPAHLSLFFTRILGVPVEPADADLLACLEQAREQQAPETAWACLAQVARLLRTESTSDVNLKDEVAAAQRAVSKASKASSLDWCDILCSNKYLPCLPAATQQGAMLSQRSWASARDAHVYVWYGGSEQLGAGDVAQSVVQELISTAGEHVLHVLAPCHCMQSSRQDSTDSALELQWLLHQVLGLQPLKNTVVLEPTDACHSCVDHLSLAQQLLRAHGKGAHAGGTRLPVPGAHLRSDVAAQLSEAMPLVIQYLAAKRPHVLQPRDTDPAGAQVPPQSDGLGSNLDLAAVLQQLVVVAVPGLGARYRHKPGEFCTQVQPAHAALLLPQHPSRAARDGSQLAVLLVTCDQAPSPAGLPTLSIRTWQQLLREFSSLFSTPPGLPDESLASLLLMHRSLAGQPAQDVLQTLQSMHQLPPVSKSLEAHDQQLASEAADAWVIGKQVQAQPSAAQQQEDQAENESEEEILWSAGAGSVVPTGRKDESSPGGSGRVDGETNGGQQQHDPASGPRGGPGLAGHAVEADELLGLPNRAGAAHGFEDMRRPGALGPGGFIGAGAGKFIEEDVEVTPSARDRCAPFSVPVDTGAHAAREQVGRWGEQFVWQVLTDQAGPGDEVQWVNSNTEQGRPYDIVLIKADGSKVFIEVKATSSRDKTYFEISHNEWMFAQQEGERYCIFRVSGSGSHEAAIKRIVNPYLQFRLHKVGICLAL